MKILKPGKVEQRKFVCPDCESVLVIGRYEEPVCPVCRERLLWYNGEPYEEPVQDMGADRKRLRELVCEWNTYYIGGAYDAAEFLLENGVTFRE